MNVGFMQYENQRFSSSTLTNKLLLILPPPSNLFIINNLRKFNYSAADSVSGAFEVSKVSKFHPETLETI